MSQSFKKGRTNNHLTFMMVDATDFASPESALSAATKIKIYGKVRGATGVNFVSSGTGSLTNDIQHVGASALGIYTIALAKADLSDASNAWYDQYIISLSATGAAYQTLVVDGGIDESALSALQSRISDIQSYLVAMSGMLSDTHSAAILGASHASDALSAANVGASRILLVQSRLSDLDSRLVSDLSDVLSAVGVGNSRALLNQSRISDIQSFLSDFQSDLLSHIDTTGVQLNASTMSDLRSAVAGVTATVSASDMSDIASRVGVVLASDLSDLLSRTTQINSRVLVIQSVASDAHSAAALAASHASDAYSAALLVQSRLSDLDSRLVSDISDLRSAVSDAHSDLKSAVGAITVSLDASNISDIASAVVAALPITSLVSDIYSLLSDLNSNFHSRIPLEPAGRSQLSDLASDVKSAVVVAQSMASDAASAAQQATSRLLVAQSYLSDIRSHVSDLQSDFQSRVPKAVATNSQLSDLASDLKSFIGAGVPADASTMSDLRSAIAATELDASDLSDIASAVRAGVASDLSDILSAAQQANSRALAVQSQASDIYSLLSDLHSDVGALSDVVSNVSARLPAALTGNGRMDADANLTAVNGISVGSFTFQANVVQISGDTTAADNAEAFFDGTGYAPAGLATSAAVAAVAAKTDLLPEGPAKNAAYTYTIKMVDATDGFTPETGLTVTMTRSLDGAAFAAATGTVTEISSGHYKVAASAADMNGDVVAHRFAATGAADHTVVIQTTA